MNCEYFLLCDREAIGTLPNPVLGPVPTCQRCADRVGSGDRIEPFGRRGDEGRLRDLRGG